MPAAPTNQLPLDNLRLHQQLMQILHRLAALDQLLGGRGRLGEVGEAELFVLSALYPPSKDF